MKKAIITSKVITHTREVDVIETADHYKTAPTAIGWELDDVYKTGGSVYKARAWQQIKNECEEDDGENYRIISANDFHFSTAYDLEAVGAKTGEVLHIVRIDTAAGTKYYTKRETKAARQLAELTA